MEKSILNFRKSSELGTVAYDAYMRLARKYGWNLRYAANFEPRRLLYAKGVSPEGYSVWFVAHSNFISDGDTNGLWKNTFEKDRIKEEWLPDAVRYHRVLLLDETKRIVFVKKASGKYYFSGIYELCEVTKNDCGNYVRIYERTSETYPEK